MAKTNKNESTEASEPQGAEAETDAAAVADKAKDFNAAQADRRKQLIEEQTAARNDTAPSNQVNSEDLTEIADRANEPVAVKTLSDLMAASADHVPSTGDIAAMDNATAPE